MPCHKVYEDAWVLSFLDISPISRGHTLVLPKKHFTTLFDIPQEDLSACMSACQKIGKALLEATKASGLNLLQNNYPAAGQIVHHIHLHLIPRFAGDNLHIWSGKHCPAQSLAEVLAGIKARL
jgi:histidine triad (HIT) family protein